MTRLYEHLMLATECSDFDHGAQAVAFALARQGGLALRAVLPLTSNPEYEAVAPQVAAQAESAALVKAESLQAEAATAQISLALQVRRGPEAYAEIVTGALESGTDLLVIRQRGKRGILANLLLGEMVSKVVSHAPCPVVVCPRNAQPWRRAVMVGLDPLAPLPSLLSQAMAVAVDSELPLHVVSVALDGTRRPLAEAAVAAAVHEARRQGLRAEGQARTGRPHEQLIAAAVERGCDLLVIARHGTQNLARAWIGGTAQKVLGLADCPVWIHIPQSTTSRT